MALALALSIIGFARAEALQHGEKPGQALNRVGWQKALNVAGMLFSLGLAATSNITWEKALWLVMAVLFIVQFIWARKSRV